jgi:hypothetical protein
MFATLLGALPRPPLPEDAAAIDVLEAVLAAQIEAGLDPLAIAGHPTSDDPVEAWRLATALSGGRLVKAVVDGPLTSDRPVEDVRAILTDLAAAGCAWIEVHEPAATGVADDAGRARFGEAHAALTRDLDGVHLSLAITGGPADGLGIGPILAGAYASLAVDLIAGPDNWRLVTRWPGERGVIAGAVSTADGSDDGPELLLWAAGYAASTRGRGPDRVGLATAGSLAALPWAVAARKLERLGEAAGLAAMPSDERMSSIDPRAVDKRSAALGRYDPPSRRPSRRISTKSRKSSSPGD